MSSGIGSDKLQYFTKEDQLRCTDFRAPHLVMLGAGASLAACPNGDKDGRELPLMNDLIEKVQIAPILRKYGVNFEAGDFETLYSDLFERRQHDDLIEEIEAAVRKYFENMELPTEATIYDYLILSLRDKDVVATFNWDPFLFQACLRNYQFANMPQMLFLHGNVAIGFCERDRIKGPAGGRCGSCGTNFTNSRMLFPVKSKNYTDEPLISTEWSTLQEALEKAYILTIFGYGAPATDVEAVSLMRDAWAAPGERNLEEIEIIDIADRDVLAGRWGAFITQQHYRLYNDFFDSTLSRFPRRSCEVLWNNLMRVKVPCENRAPRGVSLSDLQEWFQTLTEYEERTVEAE